MADMTQSPSMAPGEGRRCDVVAGQRGGSLRSRHIRLVPGFRSVWQVYVDDTWELTGATWRDMDGHFSGVLDDAYFHFAPGRLSARSGTLVLVINFEDMSIINMNSLDVRAIRRLLVPIDSFGSDSERLATTGETDPGPLRRRRGEPAAQVGMPSARSDAALSGAAG